MIDASGPSTWIWCSAAWNRRANSDLIGSALRGRSLGRLGAAGPARAWVASSAAVSVKAFARRYGVDCYTACADLIAIGFCLAPGENRWAVRPTPAPKRPLAEPAELSADFDEGWVWIGDQPMFVVGYMSGGAPYGWIDNSIGGAEDRLR